MSMEFYIPGDPVPQGRPRFRRMGNVVQTYDPKESRKWKEHIIYHVKKLQNVTPYDKDLPLALHLTFYLQRPKSHFGTGRNAEVLKASAPKYPTSKPDLDNLAKAVKDALKGLAWHDDGQVAVLHMAKQYTRSQPGVWVGVREVKE